MDPDDSPKRLILGTMETGFGVPSGIRQCASSECGAAALQGRPRRSSPRFLLYLDVCAQPPLVMAFQTHHDTKTLFLEAESFKINLRAEIGLDS